MVRPPATRTATDILVIKQWATWPPWILVNIQWYIDYVHAIFWLLYFARMIIIQEKHHFHMYTKQSIILSHGNMCHHSIIITYYHSFRRYKANNRFTCVYIFFVARLKLSIIIRDYDNYSGKNAQIWQLCMIMSRRITPRKQVFRRAETPTSHKRCMLASLWGIRHIYRKQNIQSRKRTSLIILLTFIFDRCHRSRAVVSPVRYERDIQ